MPTAVLLYLGPATRMAPFSLSTPKALIPFCNRPLLEYSLDELCHYGFTDVILVTTPQDTASAAYVAWGAEHGVDVRCVHYGLQYGSAGVLAEIANNSDLIRDDNFLVVFADSLFQSDLTALETTHRNNVARGGVMTVAYHQPPDLLQPHQGNHTAYGVLTVNADGRITDFRERPTIDSIITPCASAAVFMFNRRIFAGLPATRPLDLSRDVMPSLVSGSESTLFGFDLEPGYRFDVGTIAKYRELTFDVVNGHLPVNNVPQSCVPGERAGLLVGAECDIAADVEFFGTNVIGNSVRIGTGSKLIDCIVMDNCHIGNNVALAKSTLGRHCEVGPGPNQLTGAILGDRSVVRFA